MGIILRDHATPISKGAEPTVRAAGPWPFHRPLIPTRDHGMTTGSDAAAREPTAGRWYRWAVLMAAGALIGALVTLVGVVRTDARSSHFEWVGRTLSGGLARLATDAVIKEDRIQLSVLATRFADDPRIESASVYRVDNEILALAGAARQSAPTFTTPITFQSEVVGYARVSVNPDSVPGAPVAGLVPWLLLGVLAGAAVGAGAALYGRRPEPVAEAPEEAAAAPPPRPFSFCVVNLFNQISMNDADRNETLALAEIRAAQVARLYGGRVEPLPGTGLVVAFDSDAADQDDEAAEAERSFQILCAAVLLIRLLHAMNRDHYAEGRPEARFRVALHRHPGGAHVSSPSYRWQDDENVQDAVLLSAMAREQTLAASNATFNEATTRRLAAAPLSNPALDDAETIDAATLVTGVLGSYGALVDQQAELIISN